MRYILILLGLVIWVTPVSADDPPPTPTPTLAERVDMPDKIVITNENVKEIGKDRILTETSGGSYEPAETSSRQDQDAKKLDWQRRFAELWLSQDKNKVESEQVQRDIPGIMARFYAEDNPAYRANVLKREWDRLLELEAELGEQNIKLEADADELLKESRKAGVLPGWRREVENRRNDGELQEFLDELDELASGGR